MNFSSGTIASWYGYSKTIPKRRFRRRVGVRGPVFGARPRGRPPTQPRPQRGVQRAAVGMIRTGSPWRYMPHGLPPWQAVYQLDIAVAQSWSVRRDGPRLAHTLLRLSEGRAPSPTATILDSRTLRSTPESGSRGGYDGAKRKKGSKVHAAVDTLGNLLALRISPANEQEREYVGELAQEATQEATAEFVELAYVD
jgi:transposase